MYAIQLFIDCGNGFSEKDSQEKGVFLIKKGEQQFSFNAFDQKKVINLRLDPLDDKVILIIKKIAVKTAHDEIDLLPYIETNACVVDKDRYFFDTNDPQINFRDFDKLDLKDAEVLIVSIWYHYVGIDAQTLCYFKKEKSETIFKISEFLLKVRNKIKIYTGKARIKAPVEIKSSRVSKDYLPPNSKCDVIVPIYNALDDLKKCVNSVLLNTDPHYYRLILINDKSTDPRIAEYLKTVQTTHKEVIILSNEENLGFVKTVNKGMSYSNNNDVLLLNSDAIVTKGWLTKIQKAAYLDKRVATVTPLTNNGTICSVPNFCEDNVLPNGFTLEEFALLIERISLKKYPIIPTAVGFCMFIKRRIIKEIGLFDEENFGKGYGEENDFCCRAIDRGFINILSDDTYVFHQGSMSFKEEKAKLIEANAKTLGEKHPNYFKNVKEFVYENPLQDIQNIIKLNLALQNKKRNILYVLHNYVLANHSGLTNPPGGTEYHTKDLIDNLSNYNKYVLISTTEKLILQVYIDDKKFDFTFDIGVKLGYLSFHSDQYSEIIETILKVFNIDLIHVQHFIRHTFDMPYIAKKLSIPCVITLHDFYSLCPTIQLLDVNNVYCKETRNKEMCDQCIKKRMGLPGDLLIKWKQEAKKFLAAFDKVYAPSISAKQVVEEYFGDLINIIPREHGFDVPSKKIIKKKNTNAKFKIAFIGALTPYKGNDIIKNVIQENKNPKIEWHIFGDGEINLKARKDTIRHGRYSKDNIFNILAEQGINLICNFSIIPETFSYTLSEAWMAGLPVLAHDIGALGARIKQHQGGWTVPVGTKPTEILAKINAIVKDKRTFKKKAEQIKKITFKTKNAMAQEYQQDYEKLFITPELAVRAQPSDFHLIYDANKTTAPHSSFNFKNVLLFRLLKKYLPQQVKNKLRQGFYFSTQGVMKVINLK